MKIGMRKPSIKRSISARTTGKLKRTVNKAVNPLYGQKGMGLVNNPKKAVYNKVYNKTTVGVSDIVSGSNTTKGSVGSLADASHSTNTSPTVWKVCGLLMKFLAVVCAVIFGLPGLFAGMFPLLIVAVIAVVAMWKLGASWSKKGKELKNKPAVNISTTEPSYYEPAQSITQQNQPITQQNPKEKAEINLPPITFDTILVYNGTPQMQFEIKQTNVGDALEFEQDEEDRYLVVTQASYDIGYVHKRIADKIDALVNDGYEITGGHIAEIIQADDKLNVKVHIVLEYQP